MQNTTNSSFLKVYRSSAGSGKTFTLVKEYLKIVFAAKNTNAFKEILAITFTNKAANEMKERIIDALYLLSIGDQQMLSIYSNEIELTKDQIQEKSKKILSKILHQYSDFSVFTIDKFTHRLIRSFSQELGLTINFNVELKEKEFLNECVARLLDLIGKDKALTSYLFQFIEQNLGDSTKSNIENQLSEFQHLIFKGNRDDVLLDFKHLSFEDFSSIRSQVYEELIELDVKIYQKGKECNDLLIEYDLDADCFYKKSQRFPKMYHLLNNKERYDIKEVEKWESWLDEGKWIAGKLEPSKVLKFESILEELIEKTSYIIDQAKRLVFLREVLKLFTAYSLINQLVNQVEINKKEKGVLLISDFNRLISQIIRNEPASFIFERIGTRYKHFLFDEFQDTSTRQWSNLVPLVHESLSKGGVNLLVGDAKQAIYRWREGDVNQFLNLPKVDSSIPFSEDISQIFKNYFFIDQLDVNRRSLPEIVHFNNWLFTKILDDVSCDKISQAYKNHQQKTFRKETGYVECNICTEKENHYEYKLTYLIDVISRAIKNGYSYSDIAVIVRKNKEGSEVAEYLKNMNLPVVSGDSIVLNSSSEVNLIIDFLKAIEFDNEQSKVKLIKALKDENLTEIYFEYLIDKNKKYNRKIDICKFINREFPDFIFEDYWSLVLSEKIHYIIRIFKINPYTPYIQSLLDFLFDFIHKNGASIKGFIEHFDSEADRNAVDIGSQNAIQIITVHKSKGLQFPVVIMPFASWPDKDGSHKELIWIKSKELKKREINTFISNNDEQSLKRLYKHPLFLEEREQLMFDNLNLYYVAFTRAQDRLYLCLGPYPKKPTKLNVNDLIKNQIIQDKNFDSSLNLFHLGEEKEIKKEKKIVSNFEEYANEVQTKTYDLSLSLDKKEVNSMNYDQRLFGILMHQVLEQIIHDFQPAFQQILSLKKQLKINDELENALMKSIQQIKESKDLEEYYSSQYDVYNEIEISTTGNKIFRIDRLIIKNNQVVIIDYKTGLPKEKDREQILEYAGLLKEMGYLIADCILIYLPELRIEKVVF